ncbi:MAG: hypothetical protein CMD46_01910, partial [Gammaproteobacteria bacterium]|nr:hypothetical protein [Gammaproteobacteria bacterium]
NIPLYKFKTIEYKLLSEDYTDIVFQSIAAVKFFQHLHIFNKKNIYSMGKATYQSLLEKGFESSNPEIPGSAGLIKVIENRIGSGKFLIVKGRDGLNEIHDYLKSKKVEVDQVCCYERIKFDNYDNLKEYYFLADAIIFPSTLAVKIFFKEIYSNDIKAQFLGISNRIVESINNLGYEGELIDYFSNNLEEQVKKLI